MAEHVTGMKEMTNTHTIVSVKISVRDHLADLNEDGIIVKCMLNK
jgi:hypothetical protein